MFSVEAYKDFVADLIFPVYEGLAAEVVAESARLVAPASLVSSSIGYLYDRKGFGQVEAFAVEKESSYRSSSDPIIVRLTYLVEADGIYYDSLKALGQSVKMAKDADAAEAMRAELAVLDNTSAEIEEKRKNLREKLAKFTK